MILGYIHLRLLPSSVSVDKWFLNSAGDCDMTII